jgi:quercetin dioxygenase-like cupin family protein
MNWSEIPVEQMNPKVTRQVMHGEEMTIAKVILKAGAVVPEHHHHHEQTTLLEKGKLKFIMPDGDVIVEEGTFLNIPPHKPHRVEALEDSEVIDIFAPKRDDWIRGDDSYLRQG